MARPQKEGLEYFPIVTSFDEKIELIIAEFGPEGLGIIIGLFQRIYSNSYYINWNEDTLMLFASKYINAEKNRVNAVITRCVERNIFNKELFDKYSILTSKGIQKQYLKVCKDSRRKSVQFIKEYCLVDNDELLKVITELIGVNTEETPENDVVGTQRKEKESKEKESKEESNVSSAETLSLFNKTLDLCKYYEQLKPGQSISSQLPSLKIFIDMYGYDWTKEALQITISNKNEFIKSYMEKILKNWKADGHTTAPESKTKGSPLKRNTKNTFGNYSGQRDYDTDELRLKLLGRVPYNEQGDHDNE